MNFTSRERRGLIALGFLLVILIIAIGIANGVGHGPAPEPPSADTAAVAAAVSEPFYGDSAASRHNRRGRHRKKKPSARKSTPVAPRSPLDEPIRRDR